MSVKRARREIGPREYNRWKAFITVEEVIAEENRWKQSGRQDYMLARIAYELYYLRAQIDGMWGKPTMEPKPYMEFLYQLDAEKPAETEKTPEQLDAEREALERKSEAHRRLVMARHGIREEPPQ